MGTVLAVALGRRGRSYGSHLTPTSLPFPPSALLAFLLGHLLCRFLCGFFSHSCHPFHPFCSEPIPVSLMKFCGPSVAFFRTGKVRFTPGVLSALRSNMVRKTSETLQQVRSQLLLDGLLRLTHCSHPFLPLADWAAAARPCSANLSSSPDEPAKFRPALSFRARCKRDCDSQNSVEYSKQSRNQVKIKRKQNQKNFHCAVAMQCLSPLSRESSSQPP